MINENSIKFYVLLNLKEDTFVTVSSLNEVSKLLSGSERVYFTKLDNQEGSIAAFNSKDIAINAANSYLELRRSDVGKNIVANSKAAVVMSFLDFYDENNEARYTIDRDAAISIFETLLKNQSPYIDGYNFSYKLSEYDTWEDKLPLIQAQEVLEMQLLQQYLMNSELKKAPLPCP